MFIHKYDSVVNIEKQDISFSKSISSPSNIALVKYWGKHKVQLARNCSISFTLDKSITTTTMTITNYSEKWISFKFDGKEKESFIPKIESFISKVVNYMPYLKNYSISIDSSNSFPHSAGIASSASAFSALANLLCLFEYKLLNKRIDKEFNRRASFIARHGSGSASRSIEGPVTLWGKNDLVKGSSSYYATKINEVSSFFNSFRDLIVITNSNEKSISSRAGHETMNNHPFSIERYKLADINCSKLINVLKTNDFNSFVKIVEREALMLHSLMMSSENYYLLFNGKTIDIINAIINERKINKTKISFTLDAGPNIHILYPVIEEPKIKIFVDKILSTIMGNTFSNNDLIWDKLGLGINNES